MNRGILEAHQAGTVTTASLMANMPGFEDAVARASHAPRLELGLHLNLTVGRPLAAPDTVRSLIDPRLATFRSMPNLVLRALAGTIDPEHVAMECQAQLARLKAAGVEVTHLDSHRHVHVLPGIWEAVCECARNHGIEWVRVPVERSVEGGRMGGLRGWSKRAAIAAAYWVGARPRRKDGPQSIGFRGLYLRGGPEFQRDLLRVLDSLPPGRTELMVHPGHADDTLRGWDGYAAEREVELAALLSPEVVGRVKGGDLKVEGFRQ